MGKGASTKEKTNSTQTVNQTTTPTVAPWLNQGYQDLFGQIQAFGQSNPNALVAPTSDLQNRAFNMAGMKLGGAQTQPTAGGYGKNPYAPEINGGGGDGFNGQSMGGTGNFSWETLLGNAAKFAGQGAQANQIDPSGLAMAQASGAGAAGLMDQGLSQYLNPYQKNVTDAYSADFDANAGKVRAAQAAMGAKNQAFGGSRYGIQEAQTEGELGRARASGLAGILQGGFDRATGLADSDANRRQGANNLNAQLGTQVGLSNADAMNRGIFANLDSMNQASGRSLQAAGLFGELGNSLASNNRADIGLLAQLGDQQRGIDAQGRTAGLSQMEAWARLLGQIPTGAFTSQNTNGTTTGTGTSTTTGSGGLLGNIGQVAGAAGSLASLFSDVRLKENLRQIGFSNGLPIYAYNYVWSPDEEIGVLAHEAKIRYPDAVSEGPGGFLMVDYGRLH